MLSKLITVFSQEVMYLQCHLRVVKVSHLMSIHEMQSDLNIHDWDLKFMVGYELLC